MSAHYTPKERIIIITGHFGSGKTNIAVNLAAALAGEGKKVTICDLDIVNPYFRTADAREKLEELGVECIIPEYANSNVDIPSIPPELNVIFEESHRDRVCILDVGGEDSGAIALGMFAPRIKAAGYEMLYVCNLYRPLTADPKEAVAFMHDIESASRLRCTALVNNSNLGAETTPEDINSSADYIDEISSLSSLPVVIEGAMEGLIPGNGRSYFKMFNATKNIYGGTVNI